MATQPTEVWRDPSPGPSDGGSNKTVSSASSDDESSSDSYESEKVTPRPEKKRKAEEEEDPSYDPTEGHSSKNSRTPAREQAVEATHVSKSETQHQQILMTPRLSMKRINKSYCPRSTGTGSAHVFRIPRGGGRRRGPYVRPNPKLFNQVNQI
jgi:cytoskeletal protein RodZ